MITNKEKNTVALQMFMSMIAVIFITTNVDQKPLKNILLACVFIFMGAVFGYNLRKRTENGGKLNYKYITLVSLIVSAITFLVYKITI